MYLVLYILGWKVHNILPIYIDYLFSNINISL